MWPAQGSKWLPVRAAMTLYRDDCGAATRAKTYADWTAPKAPGTLRGMLGTFRKSAAEIAALDRVAAWTRARFALGEADAVLVTEIACRLPGCPPIETVVAFWGKGETRYRFKVFKPVREVVEDDLPPGWFKPELIDDGTGLTCC